MCEIALNVCKQGDEFQKRVLDDRIAVVFRFHDVECYGNVIIFLGFRPRRWIGSNIYWRMLGPQSAPDSHLYDKCGLKFEHALPIVFKDLKRLVGLRRTRKLRLSRKEE